MKQVTKPLLTLTALLAALAFAFPASAQEPPAGDPRQPDPALRPEVCVPGGTALAVLTGDATVAKIIMMPGRNAATVAATPRVITLDQPAAVGVCAQFQGFWSDGVTGQAAAHLQLFGANDTTTVLSQDGWRGQQTGPFIHNQPLKVFTKVDKPGTYQLVAVLSVQAGSANPASSLTDAAAKDAKRIPFTVILRAKGSISGVVTDAGGNPIAGAQVRAQLPPSLTPRGGGLAEPPVIAPGTFGDQPNPAEGLPPNTVLTNRKGEYKIDLPTGKYIVSAQARGFKVQWFEGKDLAKDATPVELTGDAPSRDNVSFKLVAVPTDPNPQPGGKGKITGIVTNADGTLPIAGAAVLASQAANSAGDARSLTAKTDEKGRYELVVPAGKWTVMAKAALYKPQWHKGKSEAKSADPVAVAEGATVPDVNFALAAAPHATITGLVTDKDGKPVAKAPVMAVKRPKPDTPLGAEGERDPATGPMVYTDENGIYTLVVEPGTWAVGAAAPMNARPSTVPVPTVWWDGKAKIEEADLLTLADLATAAGIDFELK